MHNQTLYNENVENNFDISRNFNFWLAAFLLKMYFIAPRRSNYLRVVQMWTLIPLKRAYVVI